MPDRTSGAHRATLDDWDDDFVDDQRLLERCRTGDTRAWNRLVERYGRLVYSIPMNLGIGADDADDVAQSTFAELLASIDSIRDAERLGGWLATVAKRQSIRVIERRERDRRGLEHLPVDAVDHDAFTRRVEEIEWVDQAMAAVPERCRRLLTLLYFTEPAPSYQEVASMLGIPLGSIGPTRGRCMEALASELDRLRQGAEDR
jgi:RNA polymerase sigma factor (sigma-70 family)